MPGTLNASPYAFFINAGVTAAMLLYLLIRKQGRDVRPLVALLVVATVWALGNGLDILTTSGPAKEIWHKVGQTGSLWLPFTWFLFVFDSCWERYRLKPRDAALLSILPLISALLTWINVPDGSVGIIYGYGLTLASAVLLGWQIFRHNAQELSRAIILLLCTILPWLTHLSYLLILSKFLSADPTPFIYILDALLFLFGLLRYRILNIFPVDHQRMIANMPDGVLVIDRQDYLVYLNPAAEAILNRSAREITGQPLRQALAAYPALVEQCSKGQVKALEEVMLPNADGNIFYELQISAFRGPSRFYQGRMVTLRNITRRVQAEHTSQQSLLMLRESEEKYRTLVEKITEVLFTMDLNGNFTYISSAVEHAIGFTPQSIIGRSFCDFIYPEDIPALKQNLNLVLSTQIQTLEFRLLDASGNIRYVRTYVRPSLENGKPVGFQGFVSDVTEHRLVEEALERRATQLTILNTIGEQIAAAIELKSVLDTAPRLIQTHFGYYHVAIFTPDYERGELLMRSTSGAFSELFPENHHLKFGQGMVGWAANHKNKLLANDVRLEPRYTNLYPDRILTRSELAVPILVGQEMVGVLDIQSPLVNAFDDNDVRVMETVADQIAIAMENARLYEEVRRQLKERERKENILRIQRDLLMRLSSANNLEETLQITVETLAIELNANRVAISLVDWKCQNIQPVASLGYPPSHPSQPKHLSQDITGWVAINAQPALIANASIDPRTLEFAPEIMALLYVPLVSNNRAIGVISLESTILNAFSQDDLRLLTTLANSLVMLVERARLFDEVERARTELESRATALEQANASLRELDRLKSQFLANMSHELRTPLNSIIGFSELLVDEVAGEMADEQKEFIQDILDSGRHLLTLINDLLDFSKIAAGRMDIEPSPFEIQALFDELRITISPLIEKKSQVLAFRQEGSLPAITADHLRIKQVFINLLSNANKFTPQGGMITVSCQILEPEQMLFAITDTGIGIRAEDQRMIFEEFRQVDGSMTREVNGSGLGLAISRRIVEMHQGKIWVESELGKGSTFFVQLPLCCPKKTDPVSA